ncbi:hypothetical protein [Candidatus Tisiphia endosymbiont of Ptychoptera albimana]|uniref:hypothetical protein n=1 Tax=Candidatus Tisiphia endosymbiont of Ptychoptera albimana TaxID=3066260 RepID=UPI00312C8886
MKELEGYLNEGKDIVDLTGYKRENWTIEDLIQLIRDNPNVTILKLADTDISCEDLQLLIQSGALNDITELDLSNNQLAYGDMSVIPFNKQLLSKLTVLNLRNNCMENDDVEVIVDSNLAQQFTKLDLSGNEIGNEGAEYIAKADFENLTWLNLASNSIGEGCTAILTYSGLSNLEVLDLSFNAITDQAMEDIKEYYNTHYGLLDRLQELYIGANSITAEGVINLVNIDDCFENLHTLSFYNADCEDEFIGDEGVEAIVNSEKFPNLTHLSFAAQGITDTGAEYIAESENLENLKVLDIQGNNIHDEGMRDIITSENLPELEELHFNGNSFLSLSVVMDVYKWGADKGIEIFFDSNVDTLLKAIYNETLSLMDIIFQLCEVEVKIKDECTEDKKVVEPGIKYAQHILDHPEQYPLDINDKDSQGHLFNDLYTKYPNLHMWLETRFPDHTFPYGDHTALDRQLSAELLGSTISDGAEH